MIALGKWTDLSARNHQLAAWMNDQIYRSAAESKFSAQPHSQKYLYEQVARTSLP